MKLLTIGCLEPIEGLYDRLKLEFDMLKDEKVKIQLKTANRGKAFYFFCYINDEILLKGNYEETLQMFHYRVANALSDVIINYWEPKLIKKIIRTNYFYFNRCEQKRILHFTEDVLNFTEVGEKRGIFYQIKRKTFLLHKVMDYLRNNSTIILDGFVRFRLKDYLEQLEEAVDKAIDEYLMDKEYKEFIRLLRYFVDLQEPKRDLVNVVVKDGELLLYDDQMRTIESDYGFEQITRENPDVNSDDILVSSLINMAPRKIVIHGSGQREKNEVINALYNIFEDRVIFCNSCDICLKLKPLRTK